MNTRAILVPFFSRCAPRPALPGAGGVICRCLACSPRKGWAAFGERGLLEALWT